ncbi:MAG: PHP domain-containing protein [Firmicutes bacterium]|nr:PHP domain-containing protein [Bacillota bacterium]
MTTTFTNAQVARLLELVSDLLALKGGEDAGKANTYRRAARSVESHPEDVTVLHREGRLKEIPGVGEALARKIGEILETGRLRYLDRLAAEVPAGVLDFLRLPGVGAKTAGLLWRELGLTDLDGLEEALRSGALRRLPGLGAKREETIRAGLEALRRTTGRLPLGVVRPVGLDLAARLAELPGVARVSLAGSVRRWRETVGDLDLVVGLEGSADTEAFVRSLSGLSGVADVRVVEGAGAAGDARPGEGARPAGAAGVRVLLRTAAGLDADIAVVPAERFAAALLRHTGSGPHLEALRARAASVGLDLDEVEASSEADIYGRLGLDYIPPELREGEDEVELAARRGERGLPRLLEPADVRGDLHVHSDWSDGLASLEELAAAGERLGYDYLAVTDHTRALAVARGLDEKRLLAQKEAIEEQNARGAARCHLMAGVEVDILAGGELDLPDNVLAEMDIVTASVHSGLRQPGAQMTERLVKAASNPHVDVLGHPTGRLIGRREPSDLDLDAVLEVAARSGTLLEINASPDRLDLRDADARLARRAGCLLSLGTDAHHVRALGDMEYGVATARRARLGPEDVANTRTLGELRRLLRRG